jgi:hypothetical protein
MAVVHHVAVEEEELELWWAGLPSDVRQGLLHVREEPIHEWYLANVPRGWLASVPATFDESAGGPQITLDMVDPSLRDFLKRKAAEQEV